MKSIVQRLQFFDKYSRFDKTLGRRESWEEAVARVIAFLHTKTKNTNDLNWGKIKQLVLDQKVMPSMRLLQMAGPALDRCNVGAYNCAFMPVIDLFCFSEFLYILMQGTGVGYSVESKFINQLPSVRETQKNEGLRHVIEDTTEGWCNALFIGLTQWFDGSDVTFDYDYIRPAGARLEMKGGVASGPEPLREFLDFTRDIVRGASGRKLSSIEVFDICCKAAWIVQVGGVRRAATICLFDDDDVDMISAKDYENGVWSPKDQPYRAMANISMVFNEKPLERQFAGFWDMLRGSGTGEPGIFNRASARSSRPFARVDNADFGTNPCGEIILKPFQFCNLSMAVARPDDTFADLVEKVYVATVLGTVQSTLTTFNYIREAWKTNCEAERLLGVDITGQADCALLKGQGSWKVLQALKHVAIETNEKVARVLRINRSAAITCVKPGGNSSQLLDVASGLHPRYAAFYIRRFRIGTNTPIAKALISKGFQYAPEVGHDELSPTVLVFDFPMKAPETSTLREHVTAFAQFNNWLSLKKNYTQHNPSCTIYVGEEEWESLGKLVYDNFDRIGGLTFMPKTDFAYKLAPYEEITEEQYLTLVEKLPEINFVEELPKHEKTDLTTLAQDYACTAGGLCEL